MKRIIDFILSFFTGKKKPVYEEPSILINGDESLLINNNEKILL